MTGGAVAGGGVAPAGLAPAPGARGAGLWSRWAGVESVVFCVGAQKASTSWLAEALRAHRDCHVPAQKEMHYWNSPGEPERRRADEEQHAERLRSARREIARDVLRLRRPTAALAKWRLARTRLAALDDPSVEGYVARLMHGHRGQRLVADLTPDYALLPAEVLSRMAALHEDTRFVFIMRDPVDRLWSGIGHGRRRWAGTGPGAGETEEQTLRRILREPHRRHHRRSRYQDTVCALDAAVAPGRVLYLFYETMRAPEERARLAAFLGLDALDFQAARRINAAGPSCRPPPAAALLDEARSALDETYRFVAERFGAAVPDAWRAPPAAAPARRHGAESEG